MVCGIIFIIYLFRVKIICRLFPFLFFLSFILINIPLFSIIIIISVRPVVVSSSLI